MTTTRDTSSSPMDQLDYFTEWGANPWQDLLRHAIHNCLGEESIRDSDLLEIGSNSGRIASLFAILGARVTGVDTNRGFKEPAQREAERHGVGDRVNFVPYDGDLNIFPDKSFDIIFAKSVLVVVPDLESFLFTLSRKLKPGGRVMFLENGYGNLLVHALRRFRHGASIFENAHFFKRRDMQLFRRVFDVSEIKRCWMPPIWMIHGERAQYSSHSGASTRPRDVASTTKVEQPQETEPVLAP